MLRAQRALAVVLPLALLCALLFACDGEVTAPDGSMDAPDGAVMDGGRADGAVDPDPDGGVRDGAVPPDGCVPACEGLACGDDGCGGSCGTCGDGLTCRVGRCEAASC
ncbi:MAG: hypothetical protein EVA89_19835, partial [Sandaracinaceae bacterium]